MIKRKSSHALLSHIYLRDLAKSSDKALREDQEFRDIVEHYANV